MRGLALDDVGLALASDGALLSVAPAIVDSGVEDRARSGQPALQRLRSAPRSVSTRHWLDLATGQPPAADSLRCARAELEARFAAAGGADAAVAAGDALQVAVPAVYDAASLSRLLAVLRAARLPVAGFVDAAALVTAALALRGPAIVLELGLHHIGATRVDAGPGECRRRNAVTRTRAGLMTLHDAWLQLIGEALVLRTRFDPLHDAGIEQQLYDQLPGLLAQAATSGSAQVSMQVGDTRHEVTLSRDQFATRVEPLYRELAALVHELRPAGAALTLVADAGFALLPGLLESLAQFRGCELVLLPAGYAAVAASLLDGAASDERVHLARGVAPLREPPFPAAITRLTLGGDAAREPAPTHVLWDGRAVPLGAAPLEIGRAPASGGIALADGLAGVSRLHCSLRRESGDIVVVDHSRYGLRVNGERVAGRARLRAGDRLQIGDPGVEIALIAVGAADGTT